MKTKILLKIILASLLVAFAFYGSIFLLLWIWPSIEGLIIGLCLGLALVLEIIREGYPIWFKDYTNEFWKKEEEKKCLEKEAEEEEKLLLKL